MGSYLDLWHSYVSLDGPVDPDRLIASIEREIRAATGNKQVSLRLKLEMRRDLAAARELQKLIHELGPRHP